MSAVWRLHCKGTAGRESGRTVTVLLAEEEVVRQGSCGAGEGKAVGRSGCRLPPISTTDTPGHWRMGGWGQPGEAVGDCLITINPRIASRERNPCHPPGWHVMTRISMGEDGKINPLCVHVLKYPDAGHSSNGRLTAAPAPGLGSTGQAGLQCPPPPPAEPL